ncbi:MULTISPECIES: hypothetical protein [unclassified Pseudomonas]|jgi:hypothetical protein|uniref:hypothetical protein n=1 Tax=unclassified Pseudomonas TaxID=196821 RepID=UPI00104ED565|nr:MULTISPECIES: hypothetical protein [unclassified Pseudomonas]MBD9603713.1 hypothetical protein [Pseudomonas sp. PDM10]MBV7513507.1 hypothetical protein [Pseudomonas sp. PDM25]
MSISLLEVFWNYLAFSCQPGCYKTGLLTNPTVANERKFQVFLMFFEERLISFLMSLVGSGAAMVCSSHSAI